MIKKSEIDQELSPFEKIYQLALLKNKEQLEELITVLLSSSLRQLWDD